MALTNTTKIANRFGIDLVFHPLTETGNTNDITIDFANEVSFEITGDAVYATGGRGHKRLIGFNNPIEGSMTISTQIVTPQLMALITADPNASVNGAAFRSADEAIYYSITGKTLWKDETGTRYEETMVAPRAFVRPNYSAAYTGEGDPHSIDINIELLEDPTDGMIKLGYAEYNG